MAEPEPMPENVDDIIHMRKPGETVEETMVFYEKFASTYEQESRREHYNPPKIGAAVLAEFVTDKNALILDIAAGTGLVGVELSQRGYTRLDALDGSGAMLALARDKAVYGRLIEALFTDKPLPELASDSYDAALVTGGFGIGHLEPSCLHEVLRILKPGGVFVAVIRKEFMTEGPYLAEMIPTIHSLAENGKWKILAHREVEKYHGNLPGVVFVLQKTSS